MNQVLRPRVKRQFDSLYAVVSSMGQSYNVWNVISISFT